MARGTPLKWIQEQVDWTAAKVLLDTYGHVLPTEARGVADALAATADGPYTAPAPGESQGQSTKVRDTEDGSDGYGEASPSTGPRSPIMHLGRGGRKRR